MPVEVYGVCYDKGYCSAVAWLYEHGFNFVAPANKIVRDLMLAGF